MTTLTRLMTTSIVRFFQPVTRTHVSYVILRVKTSHGKSPPLYVYNLASLMVIGIYRFIDVLLLSRDLTRPDH